MLSSKLLSVGFPLKETLTLLRHYIANQKMVSENTVKRAFKELLKDCVLRYQEK